MSKEIAIAAATLAGGATFVVHPHAAIGAAVGCCFFLAMPWSAGNLAWWRRLLLSVFSYGMGYAAGAATDGNWAMLVSGSVSAIAAIFFSALNRTGNTDGPLPLWLGQILDRMPFLKRGDKHDG